MNIRPMRPEDLEEVTRIERETFPDPWSPESFLADFRNPIVLSFVCEDEDRVAGYLVLWLFENVLHVANIAIDEGERRRGLGSELLNHAIGIARKFEVSRIELEVRRSNLAAIRFYETHGFTHVRTVKGYYRPGFEDALIYRLEL